jgi:thymidylate synthase
MVAAECGLKPGFFVHTVGDAHLYLNHLEGVKTQLTRQPGTLPQLAMPVKKVLDYQFEDFKVSGYQPAPFIKFPIAV